MSIAMVELSKHTPDVVYVTSKGPSPVVETSISPVTGLIDSPAEPENVPPGVKIVVGS